MLLLHAYSDINVSQLNPKWITLNLLAIDWIKYQLMSQLVKPDSFPKKKLLYIDFFFLASIISIPPRPYFQATEAVKCTKVEIKWMLLHVHMQVPYLCIMKHDRISAIHGSTLLFSITAKTTSFKKNAWK